MPPTTTATGIQPQMMKRTPAFTGREGEEQERQHAEADRIATSRSACHPS